MTRLLTLLAVLPVLWGQAALAQGEGFTALARIDPDRTEARVTSDGAILRLGLSQPVPYRVATWSDPARLVVDFRAAAFERLPEGAFAEAFAAHRHGRAEGPWTRLVLDLTEPMTVTQAGMHTETADGTALVEITLAATDAQTFAAAAQPSPAPLAITDVTARGPLVVAIDPSHGGSDPGVARGDLREADLLLALARDLREALRRSGVAQVVLTRDDDSFVSLEARIARARQAGADVLVSLQADGLARGRRGAQVATLASQAGAAATAQLAARQDRGDLLGGVDLSAQDDAVARVLLSMARKATQPRADALADQVAAGLGAAGIALDPRPRAETRAAVLKSADLPSIQIELSPGPAPADVSAPASGDWRRRAAQGIAQGILSWHAEGS